MSFATSSCVGPGSSGCISLAFIHRRLERRIEASAVYLREAARQLVYAPGVSPQAAMATLSAEPCSGSTAELQVLHGSLHLDRALTAARCRSSPCGLEGADLRCPEPD